MTEKTEIHCWVGPCKHNSRRHPELMLPLSGRCILKEIKIEYGDGEVPICKSFEKPLVNQDTEETHTK